MVGSSAISYHSSRCFDLQGKPRTPEPGDELLFKVAAKNRGLGYAYNGWARIAPLDPNIEMVSGSLYFGDIPPNSVKEPAQFRIAPDSPSPSRAAPRLQLYASAYQTEEDFILMIGPRGLTPRSTVFTSDRKGVICPALMAGWNRPSLW